MVVITVITVLVLASIFAFYLFSMPKKFSDKQIIDNPKSAMELCRKISDERKTNCYLRISEVLNATSPDIAFQACAEINDSQENEYSIEKVCISHLVAVQNDTGLKVSTCRRIEREDWKKECIEDLAVKEKNQQKALDLCNTLSDDNNLMEHCYSAVISGRLQKI